MNWLDIIFVDSIGEVSARCKLLHGLGPRSDRPGGRNLRTHLRRLWFYRIVGEALRPYVGSLEIANLCGFLLVFSRRDSGGDGS